MVTWTLSELSFAEAERADRERAAQLGPAGRVRLVPRLLAASLATRGIRPAALRRPGGVVRIGGPMVHIDITTKIDGIGVPTSYISARDLLRTKRAANRPKDQGDIAFLRELLGRRR